MWEHFIVQSIDDIRRALSKVNGNIPRKKRKSGLMTILILLVLSGVFYLFYLRYDCYQKTKNYRACSYFGNNVEKVKNATQKGMF